LKTRVGFMTSLRVCSFGGWIWGRVWRWICVDLGGWTFVFFWVDLVSKVSRFGDKFYES